MNFKKMSMKEFFESNNDRKKTQVLSVKQEKPDKVLPDNVDPTINIFESSIFPAPCINLEIRAVTIISRIPLDACKVFAEHRTDIAILVKPGDIRRINLVFNQNSKLEGKSALAIALARELNKMDMTVKDQRWSVKEDGAVYGATALPVRGFLEVVADCFKKIGNEAVITVENGGIEQIVRT